MELLYFISGVLSIGTIYAVILLRKNQARYNDALSRLQHFQNITSLRYKDLDEKITDAARLVADVEVKLEKDQYKSVSEINKRLEEVADKTEVVNLRESQLNKLVENNFSKAFTELQYLKNTVKKIGQETI